MRAFVFGVMILLAGCAPATNEPTSAAPPEPAAVATPAPPAAPVVKTPPAAPAPVPDVSTRAPEDVPGQGGVNYACNTAADCAVKDVGSCCGKLPQCVNKDSPTAPELVQAQCAREGMSSICGFQDIASCDCIEGRCTGVPGAGGTGELQKD